ncbi:MAG TPA: hypothetical protein VHB20_16095 [Verrucomicrobiae bacterium]|jgi:hypothetical protein|nr:hypothetical protein [Verrucomicrobiae bacterium]
MNQRRVQKWTFAALAGIAMGCCPFAAHAAATDVLAAPGAIQPGGNPNDNGVLFGVWYNNPSGSAGETFDNTVSSSNNIPGSLHVAFQCLGNTGDGSSANLAFGDWFANGSGGWLGQPGPPQFDVSQYASLDFDLLVNHAVSTNSDIPINLWGADYGTLNIGTVPISAVGWHHYSIPIPANANMSDCVAYGFYDWYNTTPTTPPAYVEFWMDNVRLVAKKAATPPPSVSITAVTQGGLYFDSGPGDGALLSSISTANDTHWAGVASSSSPVTYSMTVSSVPNPALHTNYEAFMFITPVVANTFWNPSDEGWLYITDHADGSATASLMWKTNDANDNTMYYNGQFGGIGGTNNTYAGGHLGDVQSSTILGTWSLSFTSDTNITVTAPDGTTGNFVLPPDWLTSFNNAGGGAAYIDFGGSANGNANSGQPMTLSKVSISDPYRETNDFSTTAYDSTVWTLNGAETAIIPQTPAYAITWTLPAANFSLWETTNLGATNQWQPVSGNTSLPVTVTPYTWGTNNLRALVLPSDLSATNHVFFELRKLAAVKLQVLMPGETNAPGTPTGKVGSPLPEPVGSFFAATVNAVDAQWNIVNYNKDAIVITSSDSGASLPNGLSLNGGTAAVNMAFGTTGPQTITATDSGQASITAATSSATTVQ